MIPPNTLTLLRKEVKDYLKMIRYLDEILCSFGRPGTYVFFVGFLLCFLHVTVSFTYYSLYLHFSMSIHCCHLNDTGNYSLPIKNSRCQFYTLKNPILSSRTHEVRYSNLRLLQDSSMCLEGQVYLLLCFFNCATIFGGIVFGMFSDKFGRRTALLTALLMHAAVSTSLTFSHNYIYFAVVCISEGIFIAGIQYISYILLLETLPVRYHLSAAVWTVIFRSAGVLIFSLLGWLVKNWHYLQLAISLPEITYLIYIWVLPNSFHWLLSKKKFDLLTREIERIAGFSGQDITSTNYDKLNSIQKLLEESNNISIASMLNVSLASKRKLSVCIQYFIWLCVGLTFSTIEVLPQIKRNSMLILFGKALITIGMTIFLYVLVKRIGPKIMQGIFFVAGGIFCVSSIAIEELSAASYTYDHRHIGLVVLATFPSLLNVMSIASINALRACMLYISAKTFFIDTRCFGVGTCNVWESIGLSAAPFLQVLLQQGFGFKLQSACGILMIISGILTYFLPDYWQMDLRRDKLHEREIQNSPFHTEIDALAVPNYVSENTGNRRSNIEEGDNISFVGFFPHTRQCHLRNVDETLV